MSEASHRRYAVRWEEDVGAVRRAVTDLADRRRIPRAADAALVATELATNLVRHTADGGYLLCRETARGIELLAVDSGPGTGNARARPWAQRGRPAPAAAPASAGPGLGVGLVGVERLATTFDMYSTRPGGTVVLARIESSPAPQEWCRWGAVAVAIDGDAVSGDGWAVAEVGGALAALVVDGLGHGPGAAEAARAAITTFGEAPLDDLEGFVHRAHEAMLPTRGGVLGVCRIEPRRGRLRFAGVGNVTARVLQDGNAESLAGRDGTVGTHLPAPRVHVTECAWTPGATLIVASDGVRGDCDPRGHPGLLGHDPAVVAATLLRDHGRGTDDATVLVVEDLRRETE